MVDGMNVGHWLTWRCFLIQQEKFFIPKWDDVHEFTNLVWCSSHLRETVDGRWRRQGDNVSFHVIIQVSCHVNIHVSCHIIQVHNSLWCVISCQHICAFPCHHFPRQPRSGWWSMIGLTKLKKCFISQRGWPIANVMMVGHWLNWWWASFTSKICWQSMSNGWFGWFDVVLWIGCQENGLMADGWVSSLGKMLCMSKGKCRSSIIDRVWINVSYFTLFEINDSHL